MRTTKEKDSVTYYRNNKELSLVSKRLIKESNHE